MALTIEDDMRDEKIIPYDQPELVRRVTVTGWISTDGRFYGDDEHLARWASCTHMRCSCGGLAEKPWTACDACRLKNDIERYDTTDEFMRVLTEYEGSLQSEDETEIAPARNALLNFLRPIRERIESEQDAAPAPAELKAEQRAATLSDDVRQVLLDLTNGYGILAGGPDEFDKNQVERLLAKAITNFRRALLAAYNGGKHE